jgi:hypothetical protein
MTLADLLTSGEWNGLEFDDAVQAADESELADALALATHPDADVRLTLAQQLPFLTTAEVPPANLVGVAIGLSADPDHQVRDWATFAIGQQWREVDTEAIRRALAARLDDDDRETRQEALVGLAYRRDPRALPRVRAALSRPDGEVWLLEMIAAGALGDPALHELVMRHQTGWDGDAAQIAGFVRRLTDPSGVGDDIVDGVADVYRRQARGKDDADLLSWQHMSGMLKIAPHRAAEFLELVLARLGGDEAAIRELLNSALAQDAADGG